MIELFRVFKVNLEYQNAIFVAHRTQFILDVFFTVKLRIILVLDDNLDGIHQ